MKHLWTFCIIPQPCHRNLCCWFLHISPKLDVWAENGAYGMCRLGLRYNRAKLYFSWTYVLASMIWNTSELSALHLRHVTAIFVVDCCLFDPSWIYWAENEAYSLFWLGWRYNRSELSFSWTNMWVWMILNTPKLSASHLSHVTASFVVDGWQFNPSWVFGLKMELMACANFVGGTTEQSCLCPDLSFRYQWY